MKKINLVFKVGLASSLNSVVCAVGINDTGITTCSNDTQNGLTCPVATFPRQDGDYVTNFNFTALDASGNTTTTSSGTAPHPCVRDNTTGLTWEVKNDDLGLRDKDWTYSWYDPTQSGSQGTPSGTTNCKTSGRCDTAKYVADVNATNLCGYNDWRMPTAYELVSLIKYSITSPGPTIDTTYFPNTANSSSYPYWSGTPRADGSGKGVHVSFYGGAVIVANNVSQGSVRLVHGTPSSASYVDNSNGTVTDKTTNLMWAKCSQGQAYSSGTCSGTVTPVTWSVALNNANSSTLVGYTDWRLPNVKELQSLAKYTVYSPSIDTANFPGTPGTSSTAWYWTSTPTAAPYGWNVSFQYGNVTINSARTSTSNVRLVRTVAIPYSVTITTAGTGTGTVTSAPTGINCGTTCTANFNSGTNVTLTATPDANSNFVSWSGDCSGTTNCVLTIDKAKTATATFNIAALAPSVVTNDPIVITATTAKLSGTVNPNGADTNVSFDFGNTATYDQNIVATPATVVAITTNVSADKTALTCGTTYHYRINAVNVIGTSLGTDKIFTTSSCSTTNLGLTLTDSKTSIATGTTTTYLAVVTNAGPNAANNAVLVAPTVTNLTVNNVTCGTVTGGAICPSTPSATLLQGTGLVIPAFSSGGSLTFSINATVVAAAPNGNITYNATLTTPSGVVDNALANNTAKDTNRVVSRPDFIIISVAITPLEPIAGNTFSVAATVKNQGGIVGDGGILSLWLHQPTAQSCRAVADAQLSVSSLAVGTTKVLTFSGLTAATLGNKVLRLVVDNACTTAEAAENNNQFAKPYAVGGTPDLLITSVTLNSTTPAANGTFSAAVTVKNQGSTATDGGYLDVWANATAAFTCGNEGDAWADVGNLAAGTSKTVTVSDIPSGTAGTKTFRAFIDSWCEAAESNENNNQFTKSYSAQ